MKHFLFAAFLAASVFHFAEAQTLPASRRADWSQAGCGGVTPVYSQHNILYYGAANNGSASCNIALQAAISSFHGQPGTIFFPGGTYFFNQPVNLPSGIVLKGEGRTETELIFNLNGAGSDLISIAGTIQATTATLIAPAAKDSIAITVNSTAGFAAGDYLRLSQNDTALVTSSWALGSVGQLAKISSISGNIITLQSPLRKGYSLTDAPKITRMQPVTGSGIECLSIRRLDATVGQSSNIRIENAARCWVKNIESDSSNFAHINVSTATNIEVTGSYFHGAFGYGDGGKAYGVALQATSGECLVENNAFQHLRHSMLLQSGANGNVLAYNYSIQPYWMDVSVVLPSDASGDMVLHGNWPYANLFEGNYGQNIVIDNSHGANGPFNTFFRNRAANYGVFMNTGAGDSTNLMGNEITHLTNGLYLLTGNGNLEWGNNVKGIIVPALTNSLTDNSLYQNVRPEYFAAGYNYPAFGPPNATVGNATLPAAAAMENDGCCCNTSAFVLPIRLQQFTAAAIECNALLQWSATDNTNDSYIIETSTNGKDFTPVYTMKTQGSSTLNRYRYSAAQTATIAWYRLKMMNGDGSITYSDVKSVSSSCSRQNNLLVSPNPVGSTMHLQYAAIQNEKVMIVIADASGKTILRTNTTVQAGGNRLAIEVQALLPGIYQVSLYKMSGERLGTAQRIVKVAVLIRAF